MSANERVSLVVRRELPDLDEVYLLRARILGVLIRDAREAAGLSEEACAAVVGVAPETLRAWELGQSMPSLPDLELLAYHLHVPISHFWATEPSLETERRPAVDRAAYRLLRDRLIGALLRAAREERGLSLETLAEEVGVAPGTLLAYELGQRPIPMAVLSSLASACHVPLSYFAESNNRVGHFLEQQENLRRIAELPDDVLRFISSPSNRPYLDLVMKLAALDTDRLRGIAEAILDITL
jgi:transcriptional regulator with XRE-family HTH domain